ncbi:hypothetical protein EON81_15965, partial [bacterium]
MPRRLFSLSLISLALLAIGCAGSGDEVNRNPSSTLRDPAFDLSYGRLEEQDKAMDNMSQAAADAVRLLAQGDKPEWDAAATELSAFGAATDLEGDGRTRASGPTQEFELLQAAFDTYGPPDPFADLPVVSVNQLQPGDIILETGNSVLSQAIRLGTWSHYSHAAIYIGDGRVVEALASGGVTNSALSDSLSDCLKASVFRSTNEANKATAIAFAKAQLGKPYNYLGLAEVGLYKIDCLKELTTFDFEKVVECLQTPVEAAFFMDGSAYFCSQLVNESYRSGGSPLLTVNAPTPGDLERLVSYRENATAIGRLPVGSAFA